MYSNHSTFIIDKSKGKSIWRYMDFWKFLNLIETKSLFFSNSLSLGDNYEGRIPEFVINKMLKEDKEKGNNYNKDFINYLESNSRKETLISSWTYGERESFAMWKMYAKDTSGIAIKTNLESLKNCFKETERDIYVGEILYINESNYNYSTYNLYSTFLTKLDYYKFESEIRCITTCKNEEEKTNKLVEINTKILINEVYISPNSRPEFKKLIEILKKEYKLDFEIKTSEVNDSWL